MENKVCILGAGLAGSEAALQLAQRGCSVTILEARPQLSSPVHKTQNCAELVCSNSFKSEKPSTAAGLLKEELDVLGSYLYRFALECRVPAGGALAVDRTRFSSAATDAILSHNRIQLIRSEAYAVGKSGNVQLANGQDIGPFKAIIIATGPLTSDTLASWISMQTGYNGLAFYDAAAPIVLADSIDREIVFSQSRYEEGDGDYLNAPFTKEEYESFIQALVNAKRVVSKDFETKELFQACQPIEEIARKSLDAPRFGALKPVGLVDPATGNRPWAVVQLRAEDRYSQSYNLVGFQTNLTFTEQERVFRMIPGLCKAEFSRFGVMHRNTFLDAPRLMDRQQRFKALDEKIDVPVFLAGQIAGTEGYTEAIRSGLHAALSAFAALRGIKAPEVPSYTVYGALLDYATDADVSNYQPMHVNFGLMQPLSMPVRNKGQRYDAYATRARSALIDYAHLLKEKALL